MPSVNRKRPNEPAIVVPKPSEDRPRYGRVGIIAGIGFVVGIVWPGLARVELVPQPPTEGHRAPVASGSAGPLASAEVAPSLTPATAAPPAVDVRPKGGPSAKVRLAEIIHCVDADGKKHKKCGALSLDKSVTEPLKSLVACDGAPKEAGVLSLGLDVDFGTQKLGGFTVGRSTTLPSSVAADLLACAKSVLAKADVSGVEHGFNRYRVFYLVEFPSGADANAGAVEPASEAPKTASSADTGAEVQGASGRATVAWEVALVRKSPKEGAIVARVLGGTRLVVTGRQGDWYRVKYDAQGNEGYVFKAAIGM